MRVVYLAVGLSFGVAALLFAAGSEVAEATTGTLTVQLEIVDDCQMATPATLDFGSTGVIDDDIDDSVDLSMQCTEGTAYNVGLSAGLHASPSDDVDDRHMEAGGELIAYQLYKSNAYATVWGDTGLARVASTGTGAAQTFTVWGRVPAQATPPADTYDDTVTVTMSF